MDIPLVDGNCTWSNNRDPSVWSRIDKFLLSPNWESHFPDASKKLLLKSFIGLLSFIA